jgi:hypothetical protein
MTKRTDLSTDLAWIRKQVKERKLSNIADRHIVTYYKHFDGNRQKALEALDAVWHGRVYR